MYTGIRFKGYKAFPADEYTELDNIPRVSVIIGKNNCGKSSIIDVVGMAYDRHFAEYEPGHVDELVAKVPVTRWMCDKLFDGYDHINNYTSGSMWNQTKGRSVGFKMDPEQNDGDVVAWDARIPILGGNFLPIMLRLLRENREQCMFRRISAERNILPEIEEALGTTTEDLTSTGEGASNLIRAFLNDSAYDEDIIERDLLGAVNSIMYPEAEFENIRVQQVKDFYGDVRWEVFLKEKGMGRCPLSRMGSGLKTIILVLLNLLVIPELNDYKNKNIVYGFEELENNLHPAMQRKLFEYIYEFATMRDVQVFITTHSHVAINAFYDKDDAGIFHVEKHNGRAQVKRIESYMDKTAILNDLDVKASDILQSNGIIWVEGPSDRVYIQRWLELFFSDNFIEGVHYQFLYYGGRLLSQYSASEETELINIIKTNRNAVIVMDSDKRSEEADINETKKRIIDELDSLDMMSWVTAGKEIENYIPKSVIEDMLEVSIPEQCEQYELFPDYIAPYYNNFVGKKVVFARKAAEKMNCDNMENMLDLKNQVMALGEKIKGWNGLDVESGRTL
ncbi:MAG: AAA family ATPase [Clostridiales bacterium]|nr:AAA family ATPase [Clostridiales bacterium]